MTMTGSAKVSLNQKKISGSVVDVPEKLYNVTIVLLRTA